MEILNLVLKTVELLALILLIIPLIIGLLRINSSIESFLEKPKSSMGNKIKNFQFFCSLTFVCYIPIWISALLINYAWSGNALATTLLIITFIVLFIVQCLLFIIWIGGLLDLIEGGEYSEYGRAYE